MNATDEHGGYPLGATNETPVDLAAVQADDALLDALDDGAFDEWLRRANAEFNRKLATQIDVELALAKVLDAWRRDVDTEPIGELVDRYIALDVMEAVRKRKRRRRVIGLVAAVLAGLVIAFSALGLVAKAADPGDLLWPLHELLYPLDGE